MADPGERRLTRRHALLAGAGILGGGALAGGLAFGPRAVDRLTRDCGDPGPLLARSDWEVSTGTLRARTVPVPVGYAIATPPGRADAELPVVICLPGRGGGGEEWMRRLRLADFAAAEAARSGRPFAVAAVDGGESYWHPRRGGENRLAMLLDEFLPFLANRGLGDGIDQRSLMGWSMGGYGAILAAIESRGAFARISVASPALWTSAGQTAEGAFDDAEDYDRYDVFRRAGELTIPAQILCGTGDPFHDASRTLANRISSPLVTADFQPGCHDDAYWSRVAPTQFEWTGA